MPPTLPFSQILSLKSAWFCLLEGTARILQLALPVPQAEECSACRSLKVVLKNYDFDLPTSWRPTAAH